MSELENPRVNSAPSFEKILARAAALQGAAEPFYRFSGPSDSPLQGIDLLKERWLAVFPHGEVTECEMPLTAQQMPALWVNYKTEQLLLLRAVGYKKIVGEDSQGHAKELALDELAQGEVWMPRIGSGSANPAVADHALSARDLFKQALWAHRRVFTEGAIATLVLGLLGLLTSLFTMQVYDRVIPLKGYATLWVLTSGVLVAMIFEFLMRHVRTLMFERACKAIDLDIATRLFNKALSIRLDARPKTVGTFASQLRNFESIRSFLTATTLVVFADVPLALIFILVVALLAGPVALVPLLFLPMGIVIGWAFVGPLRMLSAGQVHESNIKNGLMIEAIDGMEAIKAAGAEWKVTQRWLDVNQALADKEVRYKHLTQLSTHITQSLQQLSYIAVMVMGTWLVIEGSLSLGGLIACGIIASRAVQPIAQLPSLISQWQMAKVSLETLDAIMRLPDDRPHSLQPISPAVCQGKLRLDKLKFGYEPQVLAVDLPSLEIQPGERVAIMGPVGGGKSTLIKLLAGLYKPQEGAIHVDGVDMFQLAPEFIRAHLAYLPQDVRLFQGTLRENLTLGLPSPSDADLLQVAQPIGLDAMIASHPLGFESPIQEGGRGLSGGQRQMVGLARMLLSRPQILLLDEPTASMDAVLEKRVMDHLFTTLSPSTTIVVATHKLHVLQHVQRIVFVVNGRVAMDGPRDQVLNKLTGFVANA